jgi:hypothetical protein
MTFVSPLPIDACCAVLREQVGRRSWSRRFSPFRKWTSRVVGEVGDCEIVLESAMDLFSKRFVGQLRATPDGTVFEGTWVRPFWSRIWADERFDEQEVIRFLAEYGHFTKKA